jgi:hypothetical protein
MNTLNVRWLLWLASRFRASSVNLVAPRTRFGLAPMSRLARTAVRLSSWNDGRPDATIVENDASGRESLPDAGR